MFLSDRKALVPHLVPPAEPLQALLGDIPVPRGGGGRPGGGRRGLLQTRRATWSKWLDLPGPVPPPSLGGPVNPRFTAKKQGSGPHWETKAVKPSVTEGHLSDTCSGQDLLGYRQSSPILFALDAWPSEGFLKGDMIIAPLFGRGTRWGMSRSKGRELGGGCGWSECKGHRSDLRDEGIPWGPRGVQGDFINV